MFSIYDAIRNENDNDTPVAVYALDDTGYKKIGVESKTAEAKKSFAKTAKTTAKLN
jgi:hypothetical protein